MAIKSNKTLSKKHILRADNLLRQAKDLRIIGQIQQAADICQNIINKYPTYTKALILLGDLAYQIGQYELSASYYEKALAIKPNSANANNDMGRTLQVLGKYEEAKKCYLKAISIKQDFVGAHNNLGNLYKELGQKEDAISAYLKACSIKSGDYMTHYNLSMIKPSMEQAEKIHTLLNNAEISNTETMYYYYALGNIYLSFNEHENTFIYFEKANNLKRKTLSYDADKHSYYINQLIENYSDNYFEGKENYSSDIKQPVFILGMPRSGTSLVEQILSSHQEIYGGGELIYMQKIEKTIAKQFETKSSYPQSISLLNQELSQRYANEYIQDITKLAASETYITDKLPDNFLRIGLIKTLFPNAKIIHCKRKPLDTCMSIYLNNFVRGNQYSFDLTELGKYYQDYERLMHHWETLFGEDIYSIQYEELVQNQEQKSRELVDYLELPWDRNCLDFHKNKRSVKTTSNLQVRQPIYNKSIDRWKYYEKHISPLIEQLNTK